MMRTTAWPASIVLQMLSMAEIAKRGGVRQEVDVPAQLFLNEMAQRGITINYRIESARIRAGSSGGGTGELIELPGSVAASGAAGFATGAGRDHDRARIPESLWGRTASPDGDRANLHLPGWMAYLAAAAEFGGGILVIVGFLTRFAALAICIDMLVAIFGVHWNNGFVGQGKLSISAVAAAIAFSLMFSGAGAISIDWMRGKAR